MEKFEDIVKSHEKWNEFLEYKLSGEHMSKDEKDKLTDFIENKLYIKEAEAFLSDVSFPHPVVKCINKQNNKRKREVFTFCESKSFFLKFMAYYLMKYDNAFPGNLCSFRKDICVKTAIKKLLRVQGISKKYSYKVDVKNYFNSVDISILLPQLKAILQDDCRLYLFIEKLLSDPFAQRDGECVKIQKGIMAGVPISAFLANLYLCEMDKYFYEHNIVYIRYSDDIIVFADTAEDISRYKDFIIDFLNKHKLSVNASKEIYTTPYQKWDFLGFSYCNGIVDISDAALTKMKQKMKRKANALIRWKDKKKADNQRAIRAFIRTFNKKFFASSESDITWARWYFPVINTAESLHCLDLYMQDCIRYISNGNYSKSRFNLRYADMKACGYISLVNEFYAFKENNNTIIKQK